jgi:hypothetical protein
MDSRAATRSPAAAPVVIAASDARLHDKLKPLLNRGARMEIASDGFRSGEEFAMVAHAARNTNVPFMVLKHRVVTEQRSLEDALRDIKPEIDARAEAQRAREAAKSDMTAVVG